MRTPEDLEEASYLTWTPEVEEVIDGWFLAASGGLTRRINSARAKGRAVVDEKTMQLLRNWFIERGQPLYVRETPLMDTQTSKEVREIWGFEETDVVHVMTGLTELGVSPDVRSVSVTDESFGAELATLNGRFGENVEIMHRIYSRVAERSIGLWVPGCGVAAVVRDGDLAAVFSVAVDPQERERGLGTQLMTAASTWAVEQGVTEIFVQVDADNGAAISLYGGLGFSHVYDYRYLESLPE